MLLPVPWRFRRRPVGAHDFPRTDPDARPPGASAASTDNQLSAVQLAAGALAAVSAAVIASLFGVAGAVIGAAVASVVSTVGAALYSESLRRTDAGLRRAGSQLARRRESPGNRPDDTGDRPPLPAHLAPRRSPAGWRRLRWSSVAAAGAAVFLIAMGVVTAVELIGHQPMAALVGGAGRSEGTTLGSIVEAAGGRGQTDLTPVAPTSTPPAASTASDPPTSSPQVSESSTPTSGSESAPVPATPSVSRVSPTSSPAPTQSAGEQQHPQLPNNQLPLRPRRSRMSGPNRLVLRN